MSTEIQLKVECVNKSASTGFILSNVTFSVPKKGVHGILAPKGSGINALMKILAGWDNAFEGNIMLGEEDLREDPIARKRKIGYVPPTPSFDPFMTVEETVLFAGQAKKVPSEKLYARLREAMELLSLEEIRGRLCANLNAIERQKLSIAMALIGNPRLLLIEDPAKALNRSDTEEMYGLIQMLGKVKTVLITTDRYEEAEKLCEDIVLMADGRILAAGSIPELEETLARKQEGKGMTLSEVYASLNSSHKEESK